MTSAPSPGGEASPETPAIHLGVRPALGDVGKAGEIDGLHAVVHVALEYEVVPVRTRWSVLHVALVGVEACSLRRVGQGAPEVRLPLVQPRLKQDVRRRKDYVLKPTWDGRWQKAGVPKLAPLAAVAGWDDRAAHGVGVEFPENDEARLRALVGIK